MLIIRRCALAALLVTSTAVHAGESEPAGSPSASPDLTRYFHAEPAEAARLREQRIALEKAVEAADPRVKMETQLRLAEWLISAPTARAATRLLLGFSTAEDQRLLGDAGRDAAKLISSALKDAPDAPKQRGTELREDAMILQAFSDCLAAAGAEPSGAAQAWADAAMAMAVPRESEDVAVAACATLWQGFATSSAGKKDRALTTLPEALRLPRDNPYDFPARLLRCRVLADKGESAAALALLARIRSLCPKWFSDEPEESIAARERLVRLVELQVAQAWYKRISQNKGASALLQQMMQDIRKDLEPTGEIYTLPAAFPRILPPSTASAPAPATPDTDPAGTP